MGIAVLLEYSKDKIYFDPPIQAKRAAMAGVVFEGSKAESHDVLESEEFHVLYLPSRYDVAILPESKLVGTWQGVWPGINQTEADTAKAAPSGAPWIDTNSGFLRFVQRHHVGGFGDTKHRQYGIRFGSS